MKEETRKENDKGGFMRSSASYDDLLHGPHRLRKRREKVSNTPQRFLQGVVFSTYSFLYLGYIT